MRFECGNTTTNDDRVDAAVNHDLLEAPQGEASPSPPLPGCSRSAAAVGPCMFACCGCAARLRAVIARALFLSYLFDTCRAGHSGITHNFHLDHQVRVTSQTNKHTHTGPRPAQRALFKTAQTHRRSLLTWVQGGRKGCWNPHTARSWLCCCPALADRVGIVLLPRALALLVEVRPQHAPRRAPLPRGAQQNRLPFSALLCRGFLLALVSS